MESTVYLIKALAASLIEEIEALNTDEKIDERMQDFDFPRRVRDFEIKLIRAALLRTRGNQTKAACLLGLKLSTLNMKIKSYGVEFFKLNEEPSESRRAAAVAK
jgi:DNA-binding NtrC family response regulator